MSHYEQTEYDRQLDAMRAKIGRNLYTEMSGRNDAAIQSKEMLENLAQSTACETAYLRTLAGLIATNNEARAELASVIAPARTHAPALAVEPDPLPKVLRRPANIPIDQLASHFPPKASEKLADELVGPMRRRAGR
jgi:hypothetical protein